MVSIARVGVTTQPIDKAETKCFWLETALQIEASHREPFWAVSIRRKTSLALGPEIERLPPNLSYVLYDSMYRHGYFSANDILLARRIIPAPRAAGGNIVDPVPEGVDEDGSPEDEPSP